MREIPDPGFAGDAGEADPTVTRALAAYDLHPDEGYYDALNALQDARVLVPLVAIPGEVERGVEQAAGHAGSPRERAGDMATVLVTGRDDRLALLAFTSTAAMSRWDPAARPVPVTLRVAGRSAVEEGAGALVLDLAGPVLMAIEAGDLEPLAAGGRLRRTDAGWAWLAPPDPGRSEDSPSGGAPA